MTVFDAAGIIDPDTGRPRLCASKCPTCIYRPGNLMHLAPGRRDQLARQAVELESWIICHDTLPHGKHPDAGQAVCRGFHDVHGRESARVRLVHALGGFTEVAPPSTTDEQ